MATWLAVTPVAAWAVARTVGIDDRYPLIQLLAFTPYVAAVSVPVLAGTLLLRRWRAATVAALAVVALAVAVLPRAIPDGEERAGAGAAGGPTVTVMSSNLLFGGGSPERVVQLVRDRHVDVLALQEFTPEAVDRLAAAGLGDLLPNHALFPDTGVVGSAIYSRFPLRDNWLRVNSGGFGQARAIVTAPGAAPFEVESVHPWAPSSRQVSGHWRRGLAGQPPASPDGPVRLLIGDFNATLDHSPLRDLLATGYRDAADVVGAGFTPTWPYDRRFPKITIDHALVDRRVGVRSFDVYRMPDSDHRAFVATLVLPPG